ncbi:E2F/DP family winged-helix DNA-binding domain [Fragilaria crotonensis]|nr:E2F/DP family winged-helix DNA-binding domain [Fragilaria crotonensis]
MTTPQPCNRGDTGRIGSEMNPTDTDSSLTDASPGIRYHYHQHQYRHRDEGNVYICDKAIQTSRRPVSFPNSGPPINVTSHHASPPAYVNHRRQLPETSPNSANAARALSSLFHQCPPEYHQPPQHPNHHYHQSQHQHHHAPYPPHGPSPPSPWGGPPPPRYTYPAASQHQHSPSWHRQSPYSTARKTTPQVASSFHNSNQKSSSSSSFLSLASSTGSFESHYGNPSMSSRETSALPRSHQGQGAPSYYARAQYRESYPSIYPYSDHKREGHTPVASQPKRLLPNNNDDLHDENTTDFHLVTPTPKKIKTSPTPCEESYSRKSKSLGLLCENFCKCDWSSGVIGIDEAAKLLGVERRRIYDIINILESLDVVRRMCKNRYEWLGFARLPQVMADIQQEGICGCRGLAEEARRWGIIGRDEVLESVSEKGPAKKSLGRLSRQYLQLFLVGNEVMSLTDASDRIMGKAEEPDDIDDPMERKAAVTKGQKTKIRRLYDIANVLASIGLVRRPTGNVGLDLLLRGHTAGLLGRFES